MSCYVIGIIIAYGIYIYIIEFNNVKLCFSSVLKDMPISTSDLSELDLRDINYQGMLCNY